MFKGTRSLRRPYDYRDEDGTLLFQVARLPGKRFQQRRPGPNGEWIWKLEKTRRVLYRFPELLAADPAQPVFITEGEKDVDRLIALGLVATTNPGGALKWNKGYNEHLANRTLVILPDNDPPDFEHIARHLVGQRHALMVLTSLVKSRTPTKIKVLELTGLPAKGDVSDWLDAGGTAAQLLSLADS